MKNSVRPLHLVVLALALIARRVGAQASSPHIVTRVDTIVRGDARRLDSPSEILVAGQLLYVLNGGHEIYVLDAMGKTIRVQGRDGSGPGELRQARSMAMVHDQLRVINAGNSRVEAYDRAGRPTHVQKLPDQAYNGAVALGPDGSFLANMAGRDSTRLILLSETGALIRRFGRAMPPPPINMKLMKDEIAKGTVPPLMLLQALPVQGADGSLWLVGSGDHTVTRFDRSGAARWTTQLGLLPEIGIIRMAFFANNNAEISRDKLFMLDHFAAARARGEDLYLLLRMPEDSAAHFVVLSGAGAVRGTIIIPGATGIRSFDLSPDGHTIYMVDYYGDAILKATLPRM